MDPPEHGAYRRLIEPYLAAAVVDAFEPTCRALVRALLRAAPSDGDVDLMSALALPFAARVQCAFLGWPAALGARLIAADTDVTAALMHERIGERRLRSDEIASILRNWTVGEVGTIASAVGILAHFFANHPDVQALVRSRPDLRTQAIDEILRLDGPLLANRRVTTRAVAIGGRRLEAGSRLSLVWPAANRDGRVFDQPERFRLGRDPALNLLYGSGIHVCPGATLARMELRVVVEELFAETRWIDPVPQRPAVRACPPASGYQAVPLRLHWRQPREREARPPRRA